MRILLAGGGTGGHIFPAIAVAQAMQARARVEVLFAGSRSGLEGELVPGAGLGLHHLCASPLPRKFSPGLLGSLASVLPHLPGAVQTVRALRPDVVLGTGGYVSALAVFAAAFLQIPTVILNFDSVPGRTNRVLAVIVDRIGVSFAEAIACFPPGRCVLTGTPLRREVIHASREAARATFNMGADALGLLVFGGSQGAHRINQVVLESLPDLLARNPRLHVLHVCGRSDLDEARATQQRLPAAASARYVPYGFTHAMHQLIAAADLTVCRSGGSIAELTARGVPMILVPYPFATDHHQLRNARIVERAGAGHVILNHELKRETLLDAVQRLVDDDGLRLTMAAGSRALGIPDAADRVCNLIEELAESRGRMTRDG